MQKAKKSQKQRENLYELFTEVLFKKFFTEQSTIIKSVYRGKNAKFSAQYYITLKKDTQKNRQTLLAFLSWYGRLAQEYPVNFQFVPAELMEKIDEIELVVEHG